MVSVVMTNITFITQNKVCFSGFYLGRLSNYVRTFYHMAATKF